MSLSFILAGGGTGGHLYPGLAVAERLRRLDADCSIVFACSSRAIDGRILAGQPYTVAVQPVVPMPRGPRGWGRFLSGWVRSARQARGLIRELRPAAVLGLGGFAAAPVVKAAASAGVPSALLNPDAVPGWANRFLARRSDAIFTQFESTSEKFALAQRSRVHCVGCPVRLSLRQADRSAALSHFGLRGDRRTLLVLGGSLGAASINEALWALTDDLEALGDRWQVLHVTGPAKGQQAAPPGGRMCWRTLEYCNEMPLAYAAADLAVCRGGAATIAELSATGTPAVILPYPYHRDRQQWLNAEGLVSGGAGIVVEDRIDANANAASLRGSLMKLLADDGRLAAMTQAAGALAGRDAAQAVAEWMIQAGEKK